MASRANSRTTNKFQGNEKSLNPHLEGFELKIIWWPGRDSNPHELPRRILSPLRLPFRHPAILSWSTASY